MALLNITDIDANLANTSWQLATLNLGSIGSSTPPREEKIMFGSSVLGATEVQVKCNRIINCKETLGYLLADEGLAEAQNIRFITGEVIKDATVIQEVESIDLTGTQLTLTYTSFYSETYNQL